MTTLQECAVEVDAEPGYSSGFHVHVDMSGADTSVRSTVWLAFMMWEPFLSRVAAGRFPMLRDMNQSVMGITSLYVGNPVAYIMDSVQDEYRPGTIREMYDWFRRQDRHSNLNVRTNYDTFEFRVWNSTRSAWRMDLFSRLSVALCNPRVAAALVANPIPGFDYSRTSSMGRRQTIMSVPSSDAVDTFMTALRENRQGPTADLLRRQLDYIAAGRATDSAFTAA